MNVHFAQKKLLIDGKQAGSASGRTFETIDPATEEVITTVAEAGVEDTDLAVASARRALEGPWGQMRASERGRILYRFADLLEQNGDEVAAIEEPRCREARFPPCCGRICPPPSIRSATTRAGPTRSTAM